MKRLLLITASLAAAGGVAMAYAQPDRGQRPEQQFGWQKTPESVDPEKAGRPLTELERLSLSESGLSYGSDTYDARSDNPLEPVSVTLRALDKITARYTDLVIDIGAEAKFGTLAIVPRTCDKRPPEEVPEITAFLEIAATDDFVRLPTSDGTDALNRDYVEDEPLVAGESKVDNTVARPEDIDNSMDPTQASYRDVDAVDGGITTEDDDGDKTLFNGWMFASSPALNALEHPVYDVWVVDCKMVDPAI
ncbi:DUF2155 domain-containing protein [Aquisalinus flavus]|uniref:DUF2155 domain-containing protein n=1 Tax=Aquisalinus flavus TaxID=1526572 RepID=A0A8J2V2J6_9PROT|nr:DUF2155 domain-containing protein [Aquisalinus flavus]MBD0427461.1 DUF2155 domain-containing protein [Aquisalinus flavus]UNE47261.1 DUF2155 domain-containing protein [Aquisalinus flavus]GGD01200.1 hypothetical protein GCM10011342_07740 [Aquisalinus flavus]